ncbi:glycosyltransferase family 2 protein [Polynucleobacter sp. MG-Unter2-18]|uniref:glycosyltransferase family 2 protein n=1 Tax=Polynucleobacter sp. MG-Unter2-18 TaxID=2081052 RepID=UPI00203AE885|nr:glycosyltransferase family 2 protein [Polynucleobacter sp. MG-Unter2-18]
MLENSFAIEIMQESHLKISVVTVCYNSAKTLAKALQSVRDQNWPHVEHIVIDGGSKDTTSEILNRFCSSLAYVVSEPDNGIYDAMNKGIQRATGDIVCFLNSDDHYADKTILSRVAARMKKGELDAVFGDVTFFNEGDPDRTIRHYRSASFHLSSLAWGLMPAHPALFMRREIYSRLGGFKPEYRIAGDFEFIARAFAASHLRYEYLPEVLVKMQTGGVSTASGFKGRILHNQELLRACRENGIETNIFKILSRYPKKLLELI